MSEKTDPEHGPDRHSHEPSGPTRRHLHREGGYLGCDADLQIDYGDGTAEWLAHRLRRLSGDPWQPRRSAWLTEGDSWASPHDTEPGIDPAVGDGRDEASRPPAAGEG